MTQPFKLLWVEDVFEEIEELTVSIQNDFEEWELVHCVSREEALAQLRQRPLPDLAVLDGRLEPEPGLDPESTGYNLLADFRSGRLGEACRRIPVIVYSGIAGVIERFRSYDGPEPKPILISKNDSPREAERCIREVLNTIVNTRRTQSGQEGKHLVAHYGAGRIGLGALMPILQADRRVGLVLVNRFDPTSPFGGWAASRGSSIFVAPTPDERRACALWKDGDELSSLADIISACQRERLVGLVLTNDAQVVRNVFGHATLLTFSVGTERIRATCDLLAAARPGEEFEVHALENDHAAVHDAAAGCAPGMKLYPAVVDRICTERTFEGEDLVVVSEAALPEMYFRRTPITQAVLAEQPGVTLAPTQEAFEFWHLRKRWLMNFVHWMVSVTRFKGLLQSKMTVVDIGRIPLDQLHHTTVEREMYESICKVLAARLVVDTKWQVRASVFPADDHVVAYNRLVEYARHSVERIAKVPDTLGRVIKPDKFVSRYFAFFDEFKTDFDARKRQYLSQCGLGKPHQAERIEELIARLESYANDVRRTIQSRTGTAP